MAYSFGVYLTASAIVFTLVKIFHVLWSPLRKVPGPLLARFTNLWYFQRMKLGGFEQDSIALHRKHNSRVIRYGPNHYSISDPEALKKIYPHSRGYDKSPWYTVWTIPGNFQIFSQPNEEIHRQWRRSYGDMYSMSSMVGYEPLADECIEIFCERLKEFAAKQEAVDLAWWFQCYAADTVAMITYSQRFGYLNEGKDVDRILETVHSQVDYASQLGPIQYLHPYLWEAKKILQKIGIGKGNPRGELGKWNARSVADRRAQRTKGQKSDSAGGTAAVVERFLDANEAEPEVFTEARLNDGLISNIVAGSDTTAMTLCGAIYYLLKYPSTLEKLRIEIDGAFRSGNIATPVTFKESNSLPYLQAVIQETLRIHPAVGLPLERIVPPTGLEVDGYLFPPGTVVGANAWVIHRDATIFGERPDDFRPERWLEADKEQLSMMNRNLLAFGLGSRTCLGKNISMLEMSKVIPEIVRRFDMSFADADFHKEGWRTRNAWFVFVEKLAVNFELREVGC